MVELTREVRRKVGGYVVRMTPEGLFIREKRKRKEYGPMAYSHLMLRLAEMEADRARREKFAASGRKRRVARGSLATY